jgi:hypothetical protein
MVQAFLLSVMWRLGLRATGCIFLATLLLIGLGTASPGLAATQPNAKAILEKVEDLHRGSASHGFMTMDIKTAHWHRVIFAEFWTQGKDRTLVKVITPEKEKGTAILRSGPEVWNYLPRVKRLIKLPTSMMSAPCLGAHFNYDDLVKESRLAEDYQVDITHRGERDGEKILEITCVPKPGAPVIWGKIVVTVRQSDYLPLSLRYFDDTGRLIRTMTFSHLRKFHGRTLPSQVTVAMAGRPGEATILTYQDISFQRIFSPENLRDERSRPD